MLRGRRDSDSAARGAFALDMQGSGALRLLVVVHGESPATRRRAVAASSTRYLALGSTGPSYRGSRAALDGAARGVARKRGRRRAAKLCREMGRGPRHGTG